MNQLRITALIENTAAGRGLLGEHGLSFWIEYNGKKILFDTGQSGHVLKNNARHLGIDLTSVDAVVLSHGHYDHTGGLAEICNRNGRFTVYSHPAAFESKFSRHADGGVHDAGMPVSAGNAVAGKTGIKHNDLPVEIHPGFNLTGEIPRIADFEDTGGAFFLDRDCRIPDLLVDDQAAFIDTPSGLVVILGCAHSGVVNTLDYIRTLSDNRPIHTVVGGMHLVSATHERVDKTIMEFKHLGIKRLFPAHCTGFEAAVRLRQKFRESCSPCNVGTVIELEV